MHCLWGSIRDRTQTLSKRLPQAMDLLGPGANRIIHDIALPVILAETTSKPIFANSMFAVSMSLWTMSLLCFTVQNASSLVYYVGGALGIKGCSSGSHCPTMWIENDSTIPVHLRWPLKACPLSEPGDVSIGGVGHACGLQTSNLNQSL